MGKALKIAAVVVGVAAVVVTGGAALGLTAFTGGLSASTAALAGTALPGASLFGVSASSMLLGASVLSTVGSVLQKANRPISGAESGVNPIDFKADTNAGIPYVIGRSATGGTLFIRNTGGVKEQIMFPEGFGYKNPVQEKNKNLVNGVILSGAGPIEGIEQFWADDIHITFTGDISVSGVDKLGQPNDRFKNLMWQRWFKGDTPAVSLGPPNILPGEFPEWTENHKLNGLAGAWWTLGGDQKAYPSGTPKPLWVLKGPKVYDPRRDSTFPGGSGSQRVGDRSTWEFSENPYIHALTWLIGQTQNGKRVLGIGAPLEGIDFAAFVEGANVADSNGWKIGGTVYSTDNKWAVFEAMLKVGSGRPMRLGSKISCLVDCPRVSLKSITGADIVGPVNISAVQPRRARINRIIPRYRSEQHSWEVVAASPVEVATYVTEDGGTRSREVEYTLCQDKNQVAQLAAYDIVNAREFGPITAPLKAQYLGYRPGDCLTINEPELGLNNQKVIVLGRTIDTSGSVILRFRSETEAKHDFALGRTGVAPPTPGLTNPNPGEVAPPNDLRWKIVAGEMTVEGQGTFPAIVIEGSVENGTITGVIIEYRPLTPGNTLPWALEEYAASVTRIEIRGVLPVTTYEVRVRYRNGLGAEDPLQSRHLGTVLTGVLIAGNTFFIDDRPAVELVAELEAAVEAAQAAHAQGQVLLDELNARVSEINLNAQANMQNSIARHDAEEVEKARLYLGSVPKGTWLSQVAETTEEGATLLNLLGAKNELGTAFVLDTSKVQLGDELLATRLTTLATEIDDTVAFVESELTALSGPGGSIATAIQTLQTQMGIDIQASATTTTNAAVTREQAIASELHLLGAKNANGSAFIIDESKVLSSVTGETYANKFSGLTTTVGSHTSSIASLSSTTSSQASQISTLQSTVGSHNSQITNLQTTTANQASTISSVASTAGSAFSSAQFAMSAINGNEAYATLSAFANGMVTGMRINGVSRTFGIVASNFFIVNDQNTPIVDFQVIGGVVRARNLEVNKLTANTIVTEHLIGGAITTVYSEANGLGYSTGGTPTIHAFNYNSTGGAHIIQGVLEVAAVGNLGVGVVVHLYRDGFEIGHGSAVVAANSTAMIPYMVRDNPGAGGHNMTVTAQTLSGSGAGTFVYASIINTELKK